MDLFSGKILWGLFKRECPSFIQRQDRIILRFPQDDGTTTVTVCFIKNGTFRCNNRVWNVPNRNGTIPGGSLV
jgi:hypothetical protein